MARRSAAELAAGAAVLAAALGFLAYGVANTGREQLGGLHLNAQFDDIGGLVPGADVRISGVKVGSVVRTGFDPASMRARVDFTVRDDLKLPDDSSAQIASPGLLGSATLSLVLGGGETVLKDGQSVRITQSAANLEDLLGKFIFNVGALANASQKQLDQANRDAGKAP